MKSIPLTKGQYALVDDEDYEHLACKPWGAANPHGTGYYAMRKEKRNGKMVAVYMHREIMTPPDGMTVDHIDGNGLNNQRGNLRFATGHEQMWNRPLVRSNKSGFKGVSWYKQKGCWQANITVWNKQKFIGYFEDKIEAAKAYNDAAKRLHGEFARLNAI
jgi:hypothetical protein